MPTVVEKTGRQKAAEADVEGFREELGPFVVAGETTRMPMVFADATAPGYPIIFANEAFLMLTGYDEHEIMGQNFDFLMERGANPESLAEIRTAFAGGRNLEPEVKYRQKDGRVFWAKIFVSPVRDAQGSIVQHFASFVDVTQSKEEEARLRHLLDEMHNRIQNSLSTVLAIARQTLAGQIDAGLLEDFEGRVTALAKAQGLLGRTDWA